MYKYLKTPRAEGRYKAGHDCDLKMRSLLYKLTKRYCFPYSEGHIRDAANKYKPENRSFIEDDFRFAETINHQECIRYGYMGLQLIFDTQKKPMLELFDEYVNEKKSAPSIPSDNHSIASFPVDMSKIGNDHPFYDFLVTNNGIMDMEKLDGYLELMFDELFTGTTFYKKLRAYIDKLNTQDMMNQSMTLDARLLLDRHLYFLFPFFDSFAYSEEELARKWPRIAYHYLKMSNLNPPIEMQLIQGYSLLDMHPMFREKLKKNKNTLDNIVRDGSHCFYASKAQFFVSEDDSTRKKTSFIYKAYGIKTKVVNEADFLKMVEAV